MKFRVSKGYGARDDVGRPDEITPASARSVLSGVDDGRVFDRLTEYLMGMPGCESFGDPPCEIWMTDTLAGTLTPGSLLPVLRGRF